MSKYTEAKLRHFGPNADAHFKELRELRRKEYLCVYQNAWAKRRRLAWLKENGPCAICGSDVDLEVDHVDPEYKITHRVWSWARARREAELAKCQVLCRICHRRKTSEELGHRLRGKPYSGYRRLTSLQAVQIYRAALNGAPARRLAREFGVNHSTVIRIRKREIYASVTRAAGTAQEKTNRS